MCTVGSRCRRPGEEEGALPEPLRGPGEEQGTLAGGDPIL